MLKGNLMCKTIKDLKEETEYIIIKKTPEVVESLKKEDIDFKVLNFIRYPFS
jgi:hypothetical protein